MLTINARLLSLGQTPQEFAGELRRRAEEAASQALAETGAEISADIKQSLSVSVSGSGGKKIRSKPFEPPRSETGRLLSSIDFEVVRDEDGPALRVGDLRGEAPYAKYLEYGTFNMLARPFLAPAFFRRAAELSEKIISALRRLLP